MQANGPQLSLGGRPFYFSGINAFQLAGLAHRNHTASLSALLRKAAGARRSSACLPLKDCKRYKKTDCLVVRCSGAAAGSSRQASQGLPSRLQRWG